MRDEIQQMKAEIDRIEKERIRLATERNRVESEFAGLQSRLSSAQSSYTETLEKLDEARAALAVTEKEHDEASSKLLHVHEQKAKPAQVRAEPAGKQLKKPKEIQLDQTKKSGEELIVTEPAQELGVEEQTRSPILNVPEPKPSLPLLTNQPLPAVIPTWDSYRLESEFFTEEALDGNRVAHLVSELPGIENVLVVRQGGAVLGGSFPERLSIHLKTPGRDYEQLFNNWPNRTQKRKNLSTHIATLRVEDEFLTVTQANEIFLVVSHERPKLHAGVEEKLAVVAEELDTMYPKVGVGVLEIAGAKV
jgi:hypothetical protein